MANKEKKSKKIVFSEEIDSALEGYALSLIFIGIGLFLLLKPDYFAEPIVSYIVGAAVGLFGVMGMGVELSKTAKIKGTFLKVPFCYMGELYYQVQHIGRKIKSSYESLVE